MGDSPSNRRFGVVPGQRGKRWSGRVTGPVGLRADCSWFGSGPPSRPRRPRLAGVADSAGCARRLVDSFCSGWLPTDRQPAGDGARSPARVARAGSARTFRTTGVEGGRNPSGAPGRVAPRRSRYGPMKRPGEIGKFAPRVPRSALIMVASVLFAAPVYRRRSLSAPRGRQGSVL